MKKTRTETEKTPIGQTFVVQWFSGTPDEAEWKLRESFGEICIRSGGWEWIAALSGTNTISLFGTDDPEEKITVQVGEEDAYEKKHVRNMSVKHLAEAFSGDVEFCAVATV